MCYSLPELVGDVDVNNDGVVDIFDLIFVAQNIGVEKPSNPKVDVNEDGVVDIRDLILVAQNFD